MRSTCFRFLCLALAAPTGLAASGASAEETGFRPIFDGKTLNGWEAPDMSHWSVEEGAITGRTTPGNPLKAHQYLVWQLGELDNFELHLRYRISQTPAANSGIQFRSKIDEDGQAIGCQADIDAEGASTGALYEVGGRAFLAKRGRKTTISPKGERTESSIGDPAALWANVKKDDWNEYRVTAKDNRIILEINGKVTADVADDEEGKAERSGKLALQIHAGPPQTVQFKDIRLKRLPMEGKKKIVLVAGPRSHGYAAHEHNAGCLLLAKLLNENLPGIHATVYLDGWPEDPTAFDNADAIAIYSDGEGAHVLKPSGFPGIDALMRKGVGIAFLHYALIPPEKEQGAYMLDWIGGYYETFWSVNPFWTADFKELPRHPITRGVKPFTINDEWYYHMRFREDLKGVTPILTATPPDETRKGPDGAHSGNPRVRERMGMPEHVAWAYERPDGGRGFGFTGAHVHWNWEHDDFRKIVLNALAWIAKVDAPPNGVPSRTPTREELEANQDDLKPSEE